jgi:phospholipase/carboxylesterase
VVFLHGYGADGNDLIGLAEPLAPHLPNTRFMAPNAPEPCRNNPFGYQWFPIPWLDGSSEAEMQESAMGGVRDARRLARRVARHGPRRARCFSGSARAR